MPAETVKNTMQGKRYDKVLDKTAEQVVRAYGIRIAGQARLLAAVDKGQLKGSITYQTVHHGSRPVSPATQADVIGKPTDDKTCLAGSAVAHAISNEYGTMRNITGTPFMRPAVDIVKKGASADAALEIRKAFKEENAMRYIAI